MNKYWGKQSDADELLKCLVVSLVRCPCTGMHLISPEIHRVLLSFPALNSFSSSRIFCLSSISSRRRESCFWWASRWLSICSCSAFYTQKRQMQRKEKEKSRDADNGVYKKCKNESVNIVSESYSKTTPSKPIPAVQIVGKVMVKQGLWQNLSFKRK